MAAEAVRKFQQPEVRRVLSQGSWPWIAGPSAVACCTGSQEGVDSDLHLLTGPLVAAVAVVAIAPASGIRGNNRGSLLPLELM